ncbi:hypothetical protein [uncultured Methanobrevibacter sp.]|uniref:hypothetical protein n=1 Tax=uncultured Methanobrevibacter sp. TaxID=253161 RepID=UPI0025D69D4D|nr:hypothetical protein [uncultured Methanobrevibacter sp.]
MKIVTTPMCKDILDIAGIRDYNLIKHPSREYGDFAILLSESKVQDMDTLRIKINTFNQIFESIKKVSKYSPKQLTDNEINEYFKHYTFAYEWINNSLKVQKIKQRNKNIKVSVLSKFIKDIVEDMNFTITDKDFDYLICPDYMDVEGSNNYSLIKLPTHDNISKNPIEKAELRYSILLNINI